MESMGRQWWALVLRPLRERLAQTAWEPPPISDDEMAQLARDSWGLYGDVERHSLLLCTPMTAQEGWRHWSQACVSQPTAWSPVETTGELTDVPCMSGRSARNHPALCLGAPRSLMERTTRNEW
jgi:hypothetical protein